MSSKATTPPGSAVEAFRTGTLGTLWPQYAHSMMLSFVLLFFLNLFLLRSLGVAAPPVGVLFQPLRRPLPLKLSPDALQPRRSAPRLSRIVRSSSDDDADQRGRHGVVDSGGPCRVRGASAAAIILVAGDAVLVLVLVLVF